MGMKDNELTSASLKKLFGAREAAKCTANSGSQSKSSRLLPYLKKPVMGYLEFLIKFNEVTF